MMQALESEIRSSTDANKITTFAFAAVDLDGVWVGIMLAVKAM